MRGSGKTIEKQLELNIVLRTRTYVKKSEKFLHTFSEKTLEKLYPSKKLPNGFRILTKKLNHFSHFIEKS